MVVHLGTNTRQNKYPTGLDIYYFENREKELETLLDKEFPSILADKKVNLVNYSYTKVLLDSLIQN